MVNMVADLVERGRLEYRARWVGAEDQQRIEEAIERFDSQWLKPLREVLPADITNEQMRLVVANARREQARNPVSETR